MGIRVCNAILRIEIMTLTLDITATQIVRSINGDMIVSNATFNVEVVMVVINTNA